MRFTELFSGSSAKSIFTLSGYKAPLAIIVSVVALGVLWLSPPSFLSYSQLSASQIEIFLKSPVASQYTSSSARLDEISLRNRTAKPILPELVELLGETVKEPSNAHLPSPTGVFDSGGQLTGNVSSTAIDEETAIQEDVTLQEVQQVTERPEEKYIIPLLSYQVGTGNQLIEYKSAAVIARTLNRTLCLAPFFSGPGRHFAYLGDRHSGLYVEERYDTDVLSKFVKVARLDDCLQKCEKKMDAHWRLRHSRPPQWGSWFNETPRASWDLDRYTPSWSSTADIARTLGPRNDPKCVGLGGLFPGLRWKGVYFAASVYLQHSKIVMKAADTYQARAIGPDRYVSVHWRFEESNCRGHPLGLCFSRCADGAVIANGRQSTKWATMNREGKKAGSKDGFNGVFVTREDVAGAIFAQAVKEGVQNVYLSTDGWLRGPESSGVLKWVVEDLRNKTLNVAGLWQIPGLPNFVDGTFVHPDTISGLFGLDHTEKVSNHMIALVEQEICLRSAVFLGSGQSSWSLAVADTRRGRLCQSNLLDSLNGLGDKTAADAEREVIETILTIQYTPFPTCRDKSKNSTEDSDGVDGWLDYEACEGRLEVGGSCTRISN